MCQYWYGTTGLEPVTRGLSTIRRKNIAVWATNMTRLLLLSALPTELRADDIKKSDYYVWEGVRLSRLENNANQLEFHLTTWKGDKMKCQQQRQSSRRNDEIRTHICSTEWAILLKLRYVSCKVWAKVVCCKLKLLHCQDSFSAARQISVALLTKRSRLMSEWRRWHCTWFLSTWERYLTPE